MGIRCTKWLDADAGVRRSKIRKCESEDTEETIDGECGEKALLYVQECVGRVKTEVGRCGDHCEEDVSFALELAG
jgi:hypothetical protein